MRTPTAAPTGGALDQAARRVLAALPARGASSVAVGGLTVATVLAALCLTAALVAAVGGSPSAVFSSMLDGSLGSAPAVSQTLLEATPLLLVAVGACVSSRAGVFNIGQEGQLLVGAAAGAFVGLRTQGPPWVVLTLALVGSAAAGAAWAAISAVLRYRRMVDVVVSTLLATFVAEQLVTFLVSQESLLRETGRDGEIVASQSDALAPAFRLPSFGEYPGFSLGVGALLALGLAAATAWMLSRGRWGFRLRMLGHNPLAARHAGVREAVLGGSALAISGAFSGLAGGVVLTGDVFRLQPGMSDNYGWDGLLVALVARNNPVAAVGVAVLFGALRSGGGVLASTGVPAYLVDVMQALLVFGFVVPPVLLGRMRGWTRRRRAVPVVRLPSASPAGVELAAAAKEGTSR